MGTPTSQVQSPQSSQTSGKTGGSTLSPSVGQAQPSGKTASQQTPQSMQGSQGAVTYPGQDGQPSMGQPNNYSNTIGSWDNSKSNQSMPIGKGKGA